MLSRDTEKGIDMLVVEKRRVDIEELSMLAEAE